MTYHRLDDWDTRLSHCLSEWEGTLFKWGTRDCLLLCGEVVQSVTGEDFTCDYRGKYSTARGAKRLLPATPKSIQDFMDGLFERVKVSHARRGDIALIPDESDRLFGGAAAPIDLSGQRVLIFNCQNRLVTLPLSMAKIAWRIG